MAEQTFHRMHNPDEIQFFSLSRLRFGGWDIKLTRDSTRKQTSLNT